MEPNAKTRANFEGDSEVTEVRLVTAKPDEPGAAPGVPAAPAAAAQNVTAQNDLEAVAEIAQAHGAIVAEIEKRIVGQRKVIDHLLTALFARGHCLFVGVPAREQDRKST